MTNLTTKEHTEAHGDKIKGYRKLTDEEIDLINRIKESGAGLSALLDDIAIYGSQTGDHGVDQRWFAMAKTDLQCGIMKAVRAVAKPSGF